MSGGFSVTKLTFRSGVIKFCGIAYKRNLQPKETVMAYSQKLTEIDSIVDEMATIERLLELSNDEDWEVRERAIEKIGFYTIDYCLEEVKNRIRRGISDPNVIVRSTCLDILGEWEDTKSLEKMIEHLNNDESQIVRTSAAIAIGYIGDASKKTYLENRLDKVNDEEKVSLYFALFLLGHAHFLENILYSLSNEYYRTRCVSANLLVLCATDKNKSQILEHLKNALDKENTAAASSSLTNAIYEIENDLT
jgi:HEAT repeat protein